MTAQLASILDAVQDEPRLLIEASLRPVQGDRFQPTGFPDLGAALYRRPDGTEMLLIESAQSMANRLESVCWDDAADNIAAPLAGLPHVIVKFDNGQQTSSIQEAHRLNSPYIVNNDSVRSAITSEVGNAESGVLDIRKLAHSVFKLDACSVLHGVFLEKIAGRLRLQRLLSSFIEAETIEVARPKNLALDDLNALRVETVQALPDLIRACEFGANPAKRLEATIAPKKAKGKAKDATGNAASQEQAAGDGGEDGQ